MTQHALKVYPRFWKEVVSGNLNFQVRRDDRKFKVGDTVALSEYDPLSGYTGQGPLIFKVAYIFRKEDMPAAIMNGYCILGFGSLTNGA